MLGFAKALPKTIHKNSMYTFKVRKGYGSEELLIEFIKASGTEEMIEDLKMSLSSIGAKLEKKEDFWMNDEMLYHMNSEIGRFQISVDVWDCIFILASNNQTAIHKIESVLTESGKFSKQE